MASMGNDIKSRRRIFTHKLPRASSAIIMILFLSSCAPETVLRQRPLEFEPLRTVRKPIIYLATRPEDYPNFYARVRLPEGYGDINCGPAVMASYSTAFNSYFMSNDRMKYSKFIAFVDLDAIKIDCSYSGGREGGELSAACSYKHYIMIKNIKGRKVDEMDISGSVSFTLIKRKDKSMMLSDVAAQIELMLADAARQIYEHVKISASENKYLPPGE